MMHDSHCVKVLCNNKLSSSLPDFTVLYFLMLNSSQQDISFCHFAVVQFNSVVVTFRVTA